MKRMNRLLSTRLLANLLLILCMSGLAACSDEEELPEEEVLKRELSGQWHCLDDNQIYTLSFFRNGTGTMTRYTYSSKQWSEQTLSLQYTLSGNMLTVKPAERETFVGIAAVVGNSMSLTDGGQIVMFTRFDGSDEKINELKKEIEENLMELEPDHSVVDDILLNSGTLNAMINGLYSNLADYEYKQMLLEKIRLTKKDFREQPASPITPTDGNVANAWLAAYTLINNTNFLISRLESLENAGMDEQRCTACINEAKTLRCMAYYNMALLWGQVPYITTYADDQYENLQAPILSSEDLLLEQYNTLQGIDILPEDAGNGRMTMETVEALRGEIALSLGYKEDATFLLAGCESDFSVWNDSQSNPDMYQIFGEWLPNYTPDKTELLLQEVQTGNGEDASALADEWERREQHWGYWMMLKRTGQAQAVSGCEEHELLMPIPQNELYLIPSLKQNPGYATYR